MTKFVPLKSYPAWLKTLNSCSENECREPEVGFKVWFNFERHIVLQRKVRLKAAVLGGVLLENSCAGDGAGSNFAL